jgi:signal transduction histidine kinase
VNLVDNAGHALKLAIDPRLTLRVDTVPGNGLRFEVADNGVGIAPETMASLFRHGFTTKKDGHGFGLHGGALIAREIGGTLTVRSDGPGCGATFILEVPVETADDVVDRIPA